MKKINVNQSSGEYIKEVVKKLQDKSMYNWYIGEVKMSGVWTTQQAKEISDIKSSINNNGKAIEENREAIKENREAIKENKKAIEENREAIKENKKAIEENREAIKENKVSIDEIKSDVKLIIKILSRNGMN